MTAIVDEYLIWLEFERRRDGMLHAMNGGLWLHRHVWQGRQMAHLVSIDRERLLAYGEHVGLPADRLQFKPLKDPRTDIRRDAWHWDLVGRFLPPREPSLDKQISVAIAQAPGRSDSLGHALADS